MQGACKRDSKHHKNFIRYRSLILAFVRHKCAPSGEELPIWKRSGILDEEMTPRETNLGLACMSFL